MGFSFGATGLQGEACPVPSADGIVPFTFKPETHDAWCDCMYSSDPVLLKLCKIKFGEKLPNGDVYLDPSMPWNVSGKRTRGLLNDAIGQAMQALLHAGTQAIENAANDVGGQIGVVPFDTGSTHPAGPAGPTNTGQTNPQTAREAFQTAGQGTLVRGGRVVRQGLGPTVTPDTGWTMPALPSSNTLLYGAIAVAAAWYFLRPKTRVSVGGFGGYRKRRRVRRSRR